VANRQLIVLEDKLKEVTDNTDDEESTGAMDGKNEVLKQLEEDINGVKESLKLLPDLLSKSQEDAIRKAIPGNPIGPRRINFGALNMGVQIGNMSGGTNNVYNK